MADFTSGGGSGSIGAADACQLTFGSCDDVRLVYDTTDANAHLIKLSHAPGTATHVPAFVNGVNIHCVDLGANGVDLSGLTEPHLLLTDLDRDSAVGFGYSADDTAIVYMELGNGTTRQHVLPNVASDTFTLNCATQTLASKTLSAPTVGACDWANATHAHTNACTGGALVGLHCLVTLAGCLNYLTICGQAITRNAIDLATGILYLRLLLTSRQPPAPLRQPTAKRYGIVTISS